MLPRDFEVTKRRMIEHTSARISCHRMSKDYEFLVETAEALIYVLMIRRILKRLAKRKP